jgi:hypothetical protein
MLVTAQALALNSGDDVLVPAAGRSEPWVTDLYVMNPGSTTVSVTVSWLIRGQANPDPDTINFELRAGETAILEDIILDEFGFSGGSNANGAFRVEASGAVIVNSRIFSDDGTATFGQGFEGVPDWAATQAGQSTDAVGLTQGFGFRSNVYALAGPDGASISFSLLDPSGATVATTTLSLAAYEPYLKRVNQLFSGLENFANATLHAQVTSGSAVIGASKVDDASTDPTTLESAATSGGGSIDGYYHFGLYDSELYASGGYIQILGGLVDDIWGTYINYDKVEDGVPVCPLIFPWGEEFFINFAPMPVEDFDPANGGVTFTEVYDDGSSMTYTVEFTVEGNVGLEGSVTAVGEGFSSEPDECGYVDSGCNGTFPVLVLSGGKTDSRPDVGSSAKSLTGDSQRQPRRLR